MSKEFYSETLREIGPSGPSAGYVIVGTVREGRLYLAERQGKRYVLKIPASESGRDLELLRREWEMSIGLSHPGLSYVFCWEDDSPLGPCMVQEYVDGRPLSEYLAENPSLEARRRVFLQLLAVVGYLHGKGVIHNDLSPANILITRSDNDVKLIDLGYSDDDTHYLLKSLGGTREYASPELIAGGRVDARSDIWTLGRLMKDIFPRRYRRIAGKCTREDASGRYASVEALEKAFRNSGKPLKYSLFAFCAGALVLAVVWMGLRLRNMAEVEIRAGQVDSLETRLGQTQASADSLSAVLRALDEEKASQQAAVRRAKDFIDNWYRTEPAAYSAALEKARSRDEANAAWMNLVERYNKLYSESIAMVPAECNSVIMSYLQECYLSKFMPLYDALVKRSNELGE